MAMLAWIKSKKVFLKIQEGTGDNLLHEDKERGYVDYVLWSTFSPCELDIDGLLEMECLESGMVMDRKYMTVLGSLPDCYTDAFDVPFDDGDSIVLATD